MTIKNRSVRLFLTILLVYLDSFLVQSSLYAVEEQQIYFPETLNYIKWGLSQEEFGLIKGDEIEIVGPLTFSLDNIGNAYIFDSVKQHIKKFSNEGDYQGNLGSNISGSAIAVGHNGYFFVLENHIIHEYSPMGDLIKDHKISSEIKLVEGYGQKIIIDDFGNLYVNSLLKIYQIGKMRQNIFDLMDESQQFISEKIGMRGKIGDKWVKAIWKNKQEAEVKIFNNQNYLLKKILMSTSDMFGSILFLGQDNQGSIYIETERITKDNYVHLEVRKYDLYGNVLSIIEFPNDYYSTVYKKLELDASGSIYQILTTPIGVLLIKWQHKE